MGASNSTRPPPQRIIQNFHLVWLDEHFDEKKDDYRNSITKLRQIVNTVNTFVKIHQCIDFINSTKEEVTFMICSGALGQTAVPMIHSKQQVSDIYIFCQNKTLHEQWATEWSKVKGVFTNIEPICAALKQATQDCDQNAVSISFIKPTEATANADKDTLNCSFMYTQILKDILLTIEFDDSHINDFLTFSRETLSGNEKELKNVDRIQREYHRHQPIWWYTCDSFLYSMLNKTLRLMDVDIIVKMGFFLRDLHNDIKDLHSKQLNGHIFQKSFVVYRGQNLSQADFGQIKKIQGGLLAFNNFLSTSTDRKVSMDFLSQILSKIDMVNVLFVMHVDSSIKSTPFANIKDVSYFREEEELLFSMHSVFRIGSIRKFDGITEIWEVELTMTSDNDPELHALTEQMQEDTQSSFTGWHRLGKLLTKLAQYNKAKDLYELMLKQTNDQNEERHIYHILGMIYSDQGKYAEAVEYCKKSIKIKEILAPNSLDLATSYNNIGWVHYNMTDYKRAFEYFERALDIRTRLLPPNHVDIVDTTQAIEMVKQKL